MIYLLNILKGMVMGLAMLIPGVSGGTMAVIMGIFDPLINAVGSFFKEPKKSLKILIPIAIGGGLGILVFSMPIEWLLENLYAPTVFLFIGAVLGGIPPIYKETGITTKNVNIKKILLFAVGVFVVFALDNLPAGTFSISTENVVMNWIVLAIAGAISSIALVLPGISGSYMLLLLGLYKTVLTTINNRDFIQLIPFALGACVGVILIAKLLQFFLKKYRQSTFTVILGFVVASIFQLNPGLPANFKEVVLSIILFFAGFIAILYMSRLEEKIEK
ncbi:putative membrane protein [Lachnospiraceae bacterium PM6-15]|uniref:DUF368 domain-containing protein n=1 Tax=Ohessyouella blattaphilus TaxID=2949333 RepID=UPI003E32CD1A